MTTHRRKLLPFCIAAALLSGPAVAVGLGEIQLTSYLGKPLQAEVALNSLGDLSADQLKIEVGSEADYQALGVEHSYLHTLLKIEPFVRDGRGYVRITTREPISEPFLNFVLNVQWPQGRVVREFTVLLDPAPIAAVAVSQPEPARLSESVMAIPVSQPAARSRRSVQRPASAPAQSQNPVKSGNGDYIVQRGDSLWRIAERLRPPSAELQQVMSAIVAQNPHAFVNGDPNRIKEAARIAAPSPEHIAAALPVAPATGVAAQLALAGDATPAMPTELVEENSALKAQVAALTSNVDGLNQNLEQSQQRLRQLESQLDALLQQMQQQRATLAALSDQKVPAEPAATTATGSMINQVNAADLRPVPVARTPWWVHLLYWLGIGGAAMWAIREHFWPRRTLAALDAGELTSGTFGVSDTTGGAQPFAARATSATPKQDHSWRKSIPEPSPVLDDLELDEPALLTEAHEVIALDTVPPALDKDGDDPLVDVSISAGVFLAFGRYDEAERLLRDALKQAPARIELKLQLLDVYAQADQPDLFHLLADEIEQESTVPEVLAELAVLRESYRARDH